MSPRNLIHLTRAGNISDCILPAPILFTHSSTKQVGWLLAPGPGRADGNPTGTR